MYKQLMVKQKLLNSTLMVIIVIATYMITSFLNFINHLLSLSLDLNTKFKLLLWILC